MTIGEQIKMARKKLGYTQAEFAKRLGVTNASISLYERGVNIPSVKILLKMSQLFDIEFKELHVGEADYSSEYDAITILNLIKRGVLHPETAYSAIEFGDIQEMVETGISILEIPDTNTSERLFEVYLKALRDGTWNTGGKNDEGNE